MAISIDNIDKAKAGIKEPMQIQTIRYRGGVEIGNSRMHHKINTITQMW